MFEEDENGSFSHRREELGAHKLTGSGWFWLVLAGSGWWLVLVGSAPIRERKLGTVAGFFKAKPRHTNPEDNQLPKPPQPAEPLRSLLVNQGPLYFCHELILSLSLL